MSSSPYSEYWAALVEWSGEACGRGRHIYIAPSPAELLIEVSSAVIGHYAILFNNYDWCEETRLARDTLENAEALVERDVESLKSEAVPSSICRDWYDDCCSIKESFFWGATDYAFVRIDGPIYQFVQELLSVERKYLDAVEVKTRRQQDWFDKLLKFASLPASAWNDERVFRDFSNHAAGIKDWIYDDIENPEDNDAVSSGKGALSAEHRLLESGPIVRDTWTQKLASLLARHRYTDAYRLLDRVIEHDLPLFHGDPEVLEVRRMAWLCRIDLLREQGRLAEALAWTCLECEIIPQNVTAQAMKEQLKRKLNLGYSEEHGSPARADRVFDGWDGVAGMRELKAILERDFVLPLQEPELYERYQVDMPNGVLFYGPPGCGKTFIARALAKRLDYSFFDITPSDLGSIYVHGTQGKIRELFDKAAKAAPSLIFFDELDALIPNRSGHGVGHHYSTEVNEFLVQLNECAKRQIAVVGATNYLKKVDLAARRPGRLDKNVFIGPPDIEARQEALRLFMKDRPQGKIKWFGIAQYSEGHSFAELKFIVDEAARTALSDRRPISSDDLLAVIDRHPPQPKMSAEDYLL